MSSTKKTFPLLPHQERGVAFLREREAGALFDEQGLGKSKQLIQAVVSDIEQGALDGALIVCPNTLKATWSEEIEAHSSSRYAIFGAGRKARRDAFRSLNAHFYVINYEAVGAELSSLRALLRFKRMAFVLDESHRIKTPEASVTRAVHALRHDAAKRIILSGTPVANKPEDLWSQMYFLDDGASLGETFESFAARYGTASKGYANLDHLRAQVAPSTLRREKQGTVDLPDKVFARIPVHLTGEQARLYGTMRDELAVWVRSLSGEEVLAQAENILSRLVRLAQLASNPGLLDASYRETPAKFAALDDIVARVLSDESQKLIVWTSFVGNVRTLAVRMKAHGAVMIHGEMDTSARQRSVRAFRTDRSTRVLVANPAAAREGLTLTEASTAVYVDRTFNLVDYQQSQDRIHRLSQRRRCEIILLVGQGTVDEFVDFSLEQKQRLARYAQGDTNGISTEDLALAKPDLLRALLSPAIE